VRTTLATMGILTWAVAVAEPPTDTVAVSCSAKVSLAGLDLSSPEGARTARERLSKTARKLCSQVEDELDLSLHANYVACVEQSVTRAMQQVALRSMVAGVKPTSVPESRH
jgi:UrcA family protein